MENDEKLRDHLDSFLETSSVLAHDISGQNHVAQFCIEELSLLVQGEGAKYVSRLKSSLDEIAELTSIYRKLIRTQNPKNFQSTLRGVHDDLEQLILLYYFKEKEHVDFVFTGNTQDLSFEPNLPFYDLQQILYASYVLFLDAMMLGQLEKQTLTVDLKAELDSITMTISVHSQSFLLDELTALMEEEGPFVGKTLRRTKALEVFKKALKAEREAVRISLYCEKDSVSINLVFNRKK